MKILRLFCLMYIGCGFSQQVPSTIKFADLELKITHDTRLEIQNDVDRITSNPKYYNINAELARTYFPIIERIFEEENIPDDIKYLSLQESALISDAVSKSNAVGFWQFKDFTALEVGLRVDERIDERKNIVSSTIGAAKYMKNNNQHFDNWLYALQAYQMGAGGAKKVLDRKYYGKKSMIINNKTYWYVKKFLAHMIAYENVSKQKAKIQVIEYYDGGGKSLESISNQRGIPLDTIKKYNTWISFDEQIPFDKSYAVIFPKQLVGYSKPLNKVSFKPIKTIITYQSNKFDSINTFPKVNSGQHLEYGQIGVINDLEGFFAGDNMSFTQITERTFIPIDKLLKYNDMDSFQPLIEGQVYYLEKKKNKAKVHFHSVKQGESLWSISQKFGVKLKKLATKNRIKKDSILEKDRIIWLRNIRPSDEPIQFVKDTVNEFDSYQEEDSLKIMNDEPSNNNLSVDTQNSLDEFENKPKNNSILDSKSNKIKKYHTVRPSETLYSISKQYGVKVMDVLNWNNLDINDVMSVGQTLVLYVDQNNQQKNELISIEKPNVKYHIVQRGETLYSISKKYKVTINHLKKWNRINTHQVRVGQKLIIND